MGVTGFLRAVLQSAGTEIDLRQYRDGIDVETRSRRKQHDDDSNDDDNNNNNKRRSKKRRKLRRHRVRVRRPIRIGIDLSHWIYKACHRFGTMLADEKHLTNFGRYQLVQKQKQQEQHQHQQQEKNDDDDNDNNSDNDGSRKPPAAAVPTTTDATNSTNTTSTIDPETSQRYVSLCCLFVLERLEYLQKETNSEILAVLDGDTPPIKRETVKKRSTARKHNIRLRDAPINMKLMKSTKAKAKAKATTATDGTAKNDDNDEDDNDNDDNEFNDDDDDDGDGDAEKLVENHVIERLKANRRSGAGKLFHRVIEELIVGMRCKQIPFLVSPYEADGQLAWLSRNNYIDLIITEDSDLLAQGGKSVLYKMNISNTYQVSQEEEDEDEDDNEEQEKEKEASNPIKNNNKNNDTDNNNTATTNNKVYSFIPKGILIKKDDLNAVIVSKRSRTDGNIVRFLDMSDAMLAVICVAAESDYSYSLKGIGFVTACEIIQKGFFSSSSQSQSSSPLERIFQLLFRRSHDNDEILDNEDGQQEQYKQQFVEALIMYRHPIVYCPFRRRNIVANIDQPDPELIRYRPYRKLLQDPDRLSKIIGRCCCTNTNTTNNNNKNDDSDDDTDDNDDNSHVDTDVKDESTMATLIAEGWVSARTKKLYESAAKDENLPDIAKKIFRLKRKQQFVDNDKSHNDDNNNDMAVVDDDAVQEERPNSSNHHQSSTTVELESTTAEAAVGTATTLQDSSSSSTKKVAAANASSSAPAPPAPPPPPPAKTNRLLPPIGNLTISPSESSGEFSSSSQEEELGDTQYTVGNHGLQTQDVYALPKQQRQHQQPKQKSASTTTTTSSAVMEMGSSSSRVGKSSSRNDDSAGATAASSSSRLPQTQESASSASAANPQDDDETVWEPEK